MQDICTYIHSSGSTGYPKPIPQRHRQSLDWCLSGMPHPTPHFYASLIVSRTAVIIKGRDHGVRWASMHLPTFHTIGYYMQLYSPLTSGYPIAVFTPQYPKSPVVPNPRNIIEICRLCGVTGIPTVPAFVEVSRWFCLRQEEHTHISDANRPGHNPKTPLSTWLLSTSS